MKRVLHLLLGALVMLVALELLLQALPVSTSTKTGYYIHPNILTNPPHHRWTMATGWDLRDVQHLQANNYGFAAERDFQSEERAIGLVGDSYVEASMLPLPDRPAAQLERELGGQRPVYAMGGPGSSLLDYAERIRWAHETLGLQDFVVMVESTDASQALCNSGNVHAHCLDPKNLTPVLMRRPPSDWTKDLLRESALAQYLVSQIKFSSARLSSSRFWHSGAPDMHPQGVSKPTPSAQGGSVSLSKERQAIVDAVMNEFLRRMDSLHNVRLVFALDMNRSNLDPGVQRPDEVYHVALRLRMAGYPVALGEPAYREHMLTSAHRLAMGPHDGHLNAIGVRLLMSAAARAAQENGFNAINERGN